MSKAGQRKTYVEGTDMKCPVCGDHLAAMDSRPYETLCEHVGNPNGRVSEKTGYGCANESCRAHEGGARWLHDGEGPFGGDLPREQWTPVGTLWADINRRCPS